MQRKGLTTKGKRTMYLLLFTLTLVNYYIVLRQTDNNTDARAIAQKTTRQTLILRSSFTMKSCNFTVDQKNSNNFNMCLILKREKIKTKKVLKKSTSYETYHNRSKTNLSNSNNRKICRLIGTNITLTLLIVMIRQNKAIKQPKKKSLKKLIQGIWRLIKAIPTMIKIYELFKDFIP